MKWAEECFGDALLGDLRRSERLVSMANRIVTSPECSLSSVMEDQASNKACQRFFGCDAFEYEEIIQPAIDLTISQIEKTKSDRILLLQDSCHLNYDKKLRTLGLGHIGSTSDRSFQGIMMHWALAVTGRGESLGLAHLKLWARGSNPRKKIRNEHQSKPIEDKESYKWIEVLQSVNSCIKNPTDIVWVADREADIYEFIDEATKLNHSFVIRANSNRIIEDEEKLLKDRVRNAPILGAQTLERKNIKTNKMESIKVDIQSIDIGLVAQKRKGGARSTRQSENCELNAVRVSATDSTLNLEWILLTNLTVETLDEALEVISIYKQRWHIECVHKTLKSGFQAEKLTLGHAEKIEKAVALLLPCAIQVYWMAHLQHKIPDEPANKLLSSTECLLLKSINKKQREYPLKIKEAWLWIGYLGGHRGSKGQKPPGQITFWRGYRKLKEMARGAELISRYP